VSKDRLADRLSHDAKKATTPDTADLLKFPVGLRDQDPAEHNPFSSDHPLHGVWNEATLRAKQKIHLFNSAYESAVRELPVPTDSEGWRAYWFARWNYLVTGKFDIWAERYINVIRSEEGVRTFGESLENYAKAWLTCVKDRHTQLDVDWLLDKLRSSLIGRIEFWKSEALRHLVEQNAHLAAMRNQETASSKRGPRAKPLCFPAAVNLVSDNPQINLPDFCRLMDRKAEQHPTTTKYRPPESWKVRTFFEQYKKRSNTVSRFLSSVRKEILSHPKA
jgi:hypothetical protein